MIYSNERNDKLLNSQFAECTPRILVSVQNQALTLVSKNGSVSYPVSTALNGTGQLTGSGCTPLGHHVIRAKVGSDAPINSVFVARRQTGEIYSSSLASQFPNRDWILSRIMWLSGVEHGFNRLGNVDSMRRYIYIHGTPDSEPMGEPLSHGCIRMTNNDVIDLYERVPVGTRVLITQN